MPPKSLPDDPRLCGLVSWGEDMCKIGLCSRETPEKERDFRLILKNQLRVCNQIPRCERYHFIDAFGGPGSWLCSENGRIIGSPLIFQELAQMFPKRYKADIIEQDKDSYSSLARYISDPQIVSHFGNAKEVINQIELFPDWQTFGLVYCDPPMTQETIELSFEIMAKISQHYRMVDVMLYVGSTWMKRVNQCGGHLSQGKAKVDKHGWVIRELRGKAQYTFLIGTNWTKWAEWGRLGFYNINSPRGKKIFEIADNTRSELKEKKRRLQMTLPLPIEPMRNI